MSKERKFNESIVQPLELVEAVENSPRRIRAIGITADVVNANNRIYPRAILERALSDLRLK